MGRKSTLACELVGTYMLTFTIGCNVLSQASPLWAPIGVAFVYLMLVAAFTFVCDAHLNPAVSIAAGLAGSIPGGEVLGNICMQLLGAVGGSFCASSLLWPMELSLSPGANFTWYEAMLVESIYTAMLAFVVLNTWHSQKNNFKFDPNQFYPLAIGFVYVAGGYSAAPISGGQFNPAVSIGLAASCRDNSFFWGFIYATFQLVGAFLAAILYRLVRYEHPTDGTHDADIVLPTKLACEFIGTFMLTLTVGLNCLAGSPATAIAAGASLSSMVYALGDVSGAHLNPAVTLGIGLAGRGCTLVTGICYWIVQLAAGMIAALLAVGVYGGKTYSTDPKEGYTHLQAVILEAIFTCSLVLTVLSTATIVGVPSKMTRNFYYGLAIGMSVAVGGTTIGAISGGWMNPAVLFGSAVSSTLEHGRLGSCWRNILGELVGACCASGIFCLTHTKEVRKAIKGT